MCPQNSKNVSHHQNDNDFARTHPKMFQSIYDDLQKNNIKASNQHFYNTIKSIEHIKLKDITSTQGYYYLQRGFYDEQIRHLYKYFPRKNIYIGVFEIIKENQEKNTIKCTNLLEHLHLIL